eukprot:m.95266 g.95266  ORF g.95266 m.95266 type:complete len:308 (+) comp21908_c0_seq3:153-1076(+)
MASHRHHATTIMLVSIIVVCGVEGDRSEASLMVGLHTGNNTRMPATPWTYSKLANELSTGSHQIYNTKKHYFICLIPKVACSAWLSHLRLEEVGESHPHGNRSLTYKRISSPSHGFFFRTKRQGKEIPSDPAYLKTALVRHPWLRVISAFRSKYEGQCNFDRKCFQQFVYTVDRTKKENLTFIELAQALAKSTPERLESHFRPMHLLCELGRIPYSSIIDLSSSGQIDSLTKLLGLKKPIGPRASVYSEKRYYKGRTHLVQPCDSKTVDYVEKTYRKDAELLGYDFKIPREVCSQYGLTSKPEDGVE